MIEVDELKLVEVIKDAMFEGSRLEKWDTRYVKQFLHQIIQENEFLLDDKDCENLWDVVDFCFDAEE